MIRIVNYNPIFVVIMFKALLYSSLFLFVSSGFGQNIKETDSLSKLIATTGIDSIKGKALVQLALLYRSSDPEKSCELANRSLQIGKALDHKNIQASCHLVIGYAKYYLNDYGSAAENVIKSIEFYESGGNKKGAAMAYNQLGNIYTRQKNFKKAIGSYEESIKLKEEIGSKNDIAAVLNNIGIIQAELGKNEEAEKIFRRSLAIEIENKNNKGIAESYQSIANVSFNKDPQTAKKLYDRALFIFDSLNEKSNVVTCLVSMASAYVNKGRYTEAILYANKALENNAVANSLYNEEIIYEILKEADFKTGKYKEAYEYSEKLLALKDSIYLSELAGQTEEISTKYETVKKEKEIVLLENQNAEVTVLAQQRKTIVILASSGLCILILLILFLVFRNKSIKRQQEAEFAKNKAELEQKALRSQMNPHFLFNSLNSIQRLFVEGKSDVANEFMADFSNLLRRILNNSGKDKISLKEELDTLKLYLDIEKMRCDGCFDYKIDIDETIDQLNTNVPPLVIQPFAENAIWHGVLPKKTKGQINITIKENLQNNSLLCLVEDNGMGFDKTKINTHESKGIQITEQRLGTNVEFETSQNGTKVKIIIPLTA
jgi:tetratricopeptide (TPR) repeat protein